MERLLKIAEVSERLGVPRSTLYYWLRTGRLRAVPIPGAEKRIPAAAVRALIEAAMPDTVRPGGEG